MDAKRFVAGLMGTLLMAGSVRAQEPTIGAPTAPPPTGEIVHPSSPTVLSVPQTTPASGYDVPGISNWIRRENSPCCNGPIGKHSEIGSELYFRSGVSVPVGDSTLLSRNLVTGFTVEVGARTLFYNHEFTKAWVIDTGISNTENSGIHTPQPIPYFGARPGTNPPGPQNFNLTIRDINRTFVTLGVGREWFYRPAKDQPSQWRLGADLGGRYGTLNAKTRETVHMTDVIGGAYVGTHLLYEFPCGSTIVNVGFRTNYAYTWSDVFQGSSDLSEVNLLFSLGVRY